jgi:hypothetical protein
MFLTWKGFEGLDLSRELISRVGIESSEESFQVARAKNQVDDFLSLTSANAIPVTKENHLVAESQAPVIRSKLVSGASQQSGRFGDGLAIIGKPFNETGCEIAALTRVFEVGGDLGEIAKRAGQIN